MSEYVETARRVIRCEAQGLSEQEKALASHRVAVPLHGAAESLNVGTAATLCLYASARAQRRTAEGAV